MNREVQARMKWVLLYQQHKNISFACRHCGITRNTLKKWLSRYKKDGVNGLISQSRRPKHSPNRKVNQKEEEILVSIRKVRNLGARRLKNELLRLHNLSLSLDTIHKVLKRNQVKPLIRQSKHSGKKRYNRPIPGDRVQMDSCKITNGLFQYTAIDDCTRYRVLAVYPRRSAANTLQFIEKVVEETPFPIQRIQTDRGREFFAIDVQQELMARCIKFRPIRPRSPHLNGKVERSQKTDRDEFYSTIKLPCAEIDDRLQEWQHHYNWHRPHGSLGGKTPMDKFFELIKQTPFSYDVAEKYDRKKERFQDPNYSLDKKLKGWS
jgi:transposase InsO family protein